MPYTCDDCSLSFSRQYNLDRHRERKHPDEEEEPASESEEEESASEQHESEHESADQSTEPRFYDELAVKAWEQ